MVIRGNREYDQVLSHLPLTTVLVILKAQTLRLILDIWKGGVIV